MPTFDFREQNRDDEFVVIDRDVVRATVHNIRAIPDSYRRCSVSRAEARRRHGVGDDLLDLAVELGLPHRWDGDSLAFSARDLDNLALGLSLPSPERLILQRWRRSLDKLQPHHPGSYEIKFRWHCPRPGHVGDCEFTFGRAVSVELARTESRVERRNREVGFRVRPLDLDHEFGPEFTPVVAAARELNFIHLPRSLGSDLAFVAETGLADCRLASLHLEQVARSAGLTVRRAGGFFIGAPFPTPHMWIELRVGGCWLPADPFFLITLARWGVVSPKQWPPARSPRNVFWRVESNGPFDEAFILHGKLAAPCNVAARWLPDEDDR